MLIMMKIFIKFVIPNVIIILSGIVWMCIFLDTLNPTMNFLGNIYSMILFRALCFISIFYCIYIVITNVNEAKEEKKKS